MHMSSALLARLLIGILAPPWASFDPVNPHLPLSHPPDLLSVSLVYQPNYLVEKNM